MDSSAYNYADGAEGLCPIIKVVPPEFQSEAKEWAAYLHSITLSGNKKTAEMRTQEDIEKDEKAIEFLNMFPRPNKAPSPDFTPAVYWGFMLYNESGITKTYWKNYVGTLRKNKSDYFNLDKYLEWITEISVILSGKHPYFHDPLYYYTVNGKNKQGKLVGYFDVMNSFRTTWNSQFPSFIAKYLWKQDAMNSDWAGANEKGQKIISIEQAMENEDGGNHLASQMAQSNKNMGTLTPEDEYEFSVVEDFLRSFLKKPFTDPLPKSEISTKDFVRALVSGEVGSNAALKKALGIHSSVEQKAIANVTKQMEVFGVDKNSFAEYLSRFKDIGVEILDGKKISFRDI